MDDVWKDFEAVDRSTIALRLDEKEARALLDMLVELDPSTLDHPHETERVLLGDRLAHEMEHFKRR